MASPWLLHGNSPEIGPRALFPGTARWSSSPPWRCASTPGHAMRCDAMGSEATKKGTKWEENQQNIDSYWFILIHIDPLMIHIDSLIRNAWFTEPGLSCFFCLEKIWGSPGNQRIEAKWITFAGPQIFVDTFNMFVFTIHFWGVPKFDTIPILWWWDHNSWYMGLLPRSKYKGAKIPYGYIKRYHHIFPLVYVLAPTWRWDWALGCWAESQKRMQRRGMRAKKNLDHRG